MGHDRGLGFGLKPLPPGYVIRTRLCKDKNNSFPQGSLLTQTAQKRAPESRLGLNILRYSHEMQYVDLHRWRV